MEWIDTHAHLFDRQFTKDIDAVVARAEAAGIAEVYLPNLDLSTLPAMEALEARLAERKGLRAHACVGIHPCYVAEDPKPALGPLKEALSRRDFCAIGETGLDAYYLEGSREKQQEESFLAHCELAKAYDLPLILHGRGTTARLLSILSAARPPAGGVFHCFSGTYQEAVQAIDLGFYIGIGGVITYKGAEDLRKLVPRLPKAFLVLETDAPYLSPAGGASRRNEPSYIPLIAKVLAKCLQVPIEEIASLSTENARRLFASCVKK